MSEHGYRVRHCEIVAERMRPSLISTVAWMSPCRDVPQPVYTPSRSTTRLLSVGGAASGDGVAVTGVVGAGAGVGAGVTGAGAGTGVVGASELAAGDCAATVDS